ncbi:hypothetical protein ACGFJC_47555 [Nonomuraea fuscirosea]|uniref:hypothetical protein n=1 Tax=Nonomuraea fuscirosea TaxID=1291556 RepID=UPI00372255E8
MGARGRVRIAKSGKRAAAGFAGRHELPLNVRLPAQVAALYVYDGGMTDMLFGDYDPGLAARRGADDPLAVVAEEIADTAALLAVHGGEAFTDLSPATGGRHLYVKWAAKISCGEMGRIAKALARRYISFDPSPMLNPSDGLIVPPGAWTGGGSFRELADDPAYVDWVLDHPNGPQVWSGLMDALTPELEELERVGPRRAATTAARAVQKPSTAAGALWAVVADEDGVSWLPRIGGKLPRLSPAMEDIAVTGRYRQGEGPGLYESDSDARQAVLAGAVSCGWRLADVAARLRAGHWPGLARFYDKYGNTLDRLKALRADWDKAVPWIAGRESGREIHTRGRTHGGVTEIILEGLRLTLKDPTSRSPMDPVAALQQSRRWNSAVKAAERYRWPGPAGITKRRIVAAVLKAAQLKRSMVIGFGVRELALLACLDYSTVAKGLRELREEPNPFLVLVAEHHGEWPDFYELIVPDGYAEAAAWRRWESGRLGGIHPVFRELGGPAALIYPHLTTDEPVRTTDAALLAGISETAAKTALLRMGEVGMAERRGGGWVRGPADPYDVAVQLGVYEQIEKISERYRQDRKDWRAKLERMAARFGPDPEDTDDHSFPPEVLAALDPPELLVAQPRGP